MYKATTPTFKLIIPYTVEEINNFVISLVQQGITVLTLTRGDCDLEDHLVSFTLTQEQSNVFVHRYPINLQMRIMLNSEKVVACAVEQIDVHRVLNDTILVVDGKYR